MSDAFGPVIRLRPHRRGRVNVSVVLSSAGSPSSSAFIRLLSPLTYPDFGRRTGIELVEGSDPRLPDRTDVCIVQRAAVADVAAADRLLAEVARTGCVLVVDNDDAFAAIGPDHPEHDVLASRSAALDRLVEAADDVWVSTPRLLELHGAARRSTVVRNTLDPRIWPSQRPAPLVGDVPLRVLVMGTRTHDGDFEVVRPALDRLHAAHPGRFEVVVVGVGRDLPESPWMRRAKVRQGLYPFFVPWLVEQGPFDVGLSPLVASPFNGYKSDIKCLDYLGVGATPIVSDLEPYASPELDPLVVRVPDTEDAWFSALERAVLDRASDRASATDRRARGDAYLHKERSVETAARLMRARLRDLA